MSEPDKIRKTPEYRMRATAKYRGKGVRKEIVFPETELDVYDFADSECRRQNIGFQRYIINLIRERMDK